MYTMATLTGVAALAAGVTLAALIAKGDITVR
jgi:hypothetical protein